MVKSKILGIFVGLLSAVIVGAVQSPEAHAGGFCYWTGAGGDNKFSTPANWTNCTNVNGNLPDSSSVLIFGPTGSTSSDVHIQNDFGALGSGLPGIYFWRVIYGVDQNLDPIQSSAVKTRYHIDQLWLNGTGANNTVMFDGARSMDGGINTTVSVGDISYGNGAPYSYSISGYGLGGSPGDTTCFPTNATGLYLSNVAGSALSPDSTGCQMSFNVAGPIEIGDDSAEYTYSGTSATSITAKQGSTLKGTGTVNGSVLIEQYAYLAPGNSPGCLSSETLTLNGEYLFEVGGVNACTGYDQFTASSTTANPSVTLGAGATLFTSIFGNFVPQVGQVYRIIDNAGSGSVNGTFQGLGEGSTFEQDGVTYRISYVGGTGNDVTLSVVSVDPSVVGPAAGETGTTSGPSVPNTGFELLRANPFMTLVMTVVAAGTVMLISKRVRQ